MNIHVQAGAACIDITPPIGLAMSGYSARTDLASGTHDPLTVRAVAVNDTAIICADVIGLDADSCRRIRERAALPQNRLVVTALHTHGGPVVIPGGLGKMTDRHYLTQLEDACVTAIDAACAAQKPARLYFGDGPDPGIAKNRRHKDGLVDPHLPVLQIRALDGEWIAVITSYACHPVVLGADNTLWTADYPGVVRKALEKAYPGALALFLTGCTGDANIGHSAHDSFNTEPMRTRTFEEAERIGLQVANCAIAADFKEIRHEITMTCTEILLDLEHSESVSPEQLASLWRNERATADPAQTALLTDCINWAETVALRPLEPWLARVSVLNWGGICIVALPGEIFAETALDIRHRLNIESAFVIGYADGCPGYLPPASEYAHSGYEVNEAYRYYGMPAAFATGSAEHLAEVALSLTQTFKNLD